ncbi:MAG: gliding motility-associated C-terminal domain-containing protein [Chitinophagales bacterium]|nr:gliding motility-associated C-terminal domain-containing protein [Chitinophagales bacterium]
MKRIYHILLLSLLATFPATAQQQIQLFVEDFENGNNYFVTDTVANGKEKWIVNNEYNGQSVYPFTTRQDSVYFGNGTITNAPFSTYLHIHDSTLAPGIANANYDPSAPSEDFVYTAAGFCTKGMEDVKLVFFYIVEGDTINSSPTAWGEVYYSIDGGPWVQTGDPKYYKQTNWRYEQIQDTAFNDVVNLRIGFKWVNNGGSQTKTISFGVDDIQMVATYDDVNNPVQINIVDVFPDTVCRQNFLVLQWELSSQLCDATYQIELSNATGNFANPRQMGVFDIFYPDTTGFIGITIPSNIPLGTCYKVRLVRLSPAPTIIGSASTCFVVRNCPNTITTLTPIVVTDADTVCSRSAIDVPFFSTGVFNSSNIYRAELSDSNGTFNNPQTIGTFPSSQTYDPSLGSPPGNVSGLIPSTPAGCNYYIRVVSTNPSATGSVYGPFCISQCDMLTNNTVDIQLCITEQTGIDTVISVGINTWDTLANYAPGNQFSVQLLSRMTLALINEGGLGAVFDTTTNTFNLIVPGLFDLLNLGIAPGSYYARIVSDSSNLSYDQNGTIIRLTIGAPADNPPNILTTDSVFCNTEVVGFIIDPYNPDSDYEWLSADLNNGQPFIWPGNTLLVNFTGAPVNDYTVLVREINFGCYGGYAQGKTINIISVPDGDITGEDKVCLGDTVQFQFPYQPATYYGWDISAGNLIDTSNNEISTVFDSVGNYDIFVYALNECGSSRDTAEIEVVSLLSIDAGKDTSVCAGEPVELIATTQGFSRGLSTTVSNAGPNAQGFMFDVSANDDLTITSLDANFNSTVPNADVRVYFKTGTHDGFEGDSTQWTLLGVATGVVPNLPGTLTPLPIPMNVSVSAGDTIAFYVTTTNSARMKYVNGTQENRIFSTDGIMNIHEGTLNIYPFAANTAPRVWSGRVNYFTYGGLTYQWSSGDTTRNATVRPTATTEYSILANDTTGCGNTDKVTVSVFAAPAADAGDSVTVCAGNTVSVNASADGSFTWEPTNGLSDPNSLTPTITPDSSVSYILTVSGQNGCSNKDTLNITVQVLSENKDSLGLCKDQTLELSLPETAGAQYQWNNGDVTRTISVNVPGVYTALYNDGSGNCPARYVFSVQDYDCESILQIPTAFSPNGDGLNDYFTIFGKNIVKYQLEIFNRWGELVYSTTDANELNDLQKGWDGRHRGELQNLAAFVYRVRATDALGVSIDKSGSFTLVR